MSLKGFGVMSCATYLAISIAPAVQGVVQIREGVAGLPGWRDIASLPVWRREGVSIGEENERR